MSKSKAPSSLKDRIEAVSSADTLINATVIQQLFEDVLEGVEEVAPRLSVLQEPNQKQKTSVKVTKDQGVETLQEFEKFLEDQRKLQQKWIEAMVTHASFEDISTLFRQYLQNGASQKLSLKHQKSIWTE